MSTDTSFQRMAVIGIGQFGLRLMAYLWPRIRFQALQREVFCKEGHNLQRHLPYLRDLVSFILVFPTPDGTIHIGHPNPDRWDEDLFIRDLLKAESGEPPWKPDMLTDAYELRVELDTEGLMTRGGLFRTAIGAEVELVECLSWLLRAARLDEAAPGQEVVRFRLFQYAPVFHASGEQRQLFCVPVVWRGNGQQKRDDRHHDHQFNKRKTAWTFQHFLSLAFLCKRLL